MSDYNTFFHSDQHVSGRFNNGLVDSKFISYISDFHILLCRDELFPMADLVTPNLSEASTLIGGDPVTTVAEMRMAAEAIHQFGPRLIPHSSTIFGSPFISALWKLSPNLGIVTAT